MAADFIMTYDRTILNESSNHFILNLYYYTGMKKKNPGDLPPNSQIFILANLLCDVMYMPNTRRLNSLDST